MTLYIRKDLKTGEYVGDPAPLPKELVGLAEFGDGGLSDLNWTHETSGWRGYGYERYVAPEPQVNARVISPLAFMQRLTAEERIAIRIAGREDLVVEDYLDLLSKATLMELDHKDTINGVMFLVSKGLLSEDRAQAILE